MKKDIKSIFDDPKNVKHTPEQTIYVKDLEQLSSLLSPKRIETFIQLIQYKSNPCGVSQLAKLLNRKQEAVSRDLSILEKHGLITKTKKGKETLLSAIVKSIEIQFA